MSHRGSSRITDHVAIRVASIEAATHFYEAAFDAVPLTDPFEISGELAERILGCPPGAVLRMRQLGFADGVMELVETTPARATGRAPADRLNVLHIGIHVDDLAGTLARVLAAGGSLVVPTMSWGSASLCFCTDLDGTVLELADAPIEELLTHTRARSAGDAVTPE